jgi:hypothetical protein
MKQLETVIDYKAGDIVVPVSTTVKPEFCLVNSISEKGAFISFVDYPDNEFFVATNEMHKLKKHRTGSMLYGKKR